MMFAAVLILLGIFGMLAVSAWALNRLAVVAVLLFAADALAGGCGYVSQYVAPTYAQTIVQPYVVPVVQPVIYYGVGAAAVAPVTAGYAAPAVQQPVAGYQQPLHAQQSAPRNDFRERLEDLRLLMGLLRGEDVQSQPITARPPAAAQTTGSVIATKCVECHSGNAPKGNLSLEPGSPLDARAGMKILRRVKDDAAHNRMPKPPLPPLTAAEKGRLMDELMSLIPDE